MTNASAEPAIDLGALLGASLAQWAVDARLEPAGDAAVVRWGDGAAVRIGRRRAPDGTGAAWTLDDEPLASVLEVLREVRHAVDPDFAPARLRIGPPPPDDEDGPGIRDFAPRRRTEGAVGRLPVFVLTGFLGSGKTTLLNRLLRAEGFRDTAVVVNELGAIGIDHLLVESSDDDSVVELAGGCLCCAVRGDLARTLSELVARREAGACAPFSRILIETSGLADPTPIESLLLADPALAERMKLAGVTACVAATTGDSVLDRYPEAVRQVAAANLLVTTKTDLAAVPAALDERLRYINPGANRVAAEFGRVRPADGAADNAETDGTHADVLLLRRFSRRLPAPASDESVRHAVGIDTFTLVRHKPIAGAALTLFLRALVEHAGPRLLRLKGFVEIAEAPDRPVTVNGAGHVFEPVEPRSGGWPDADRRSRLVLIGEGISAPWCDRLLDALDLDVREAARFRGYTSQRTGSA